MFTDNAVQLHRPRLLAGVVLGTIGLFGLFTLLVGVIVFGWLM